MGLKNKGFCCAFLYLVDNSRDTFDEGLAKKGQRVFLIVGSCYVVELLVIEDVDGSVECVVDK